MVPLDTFYAAYEASDSPSSAENIAAPAQEGDVHGGTCMILSEHDVTPRASFAAPRVWQCCCHS